MSKKWGPIGRWQSCAYQQVIRNHTNFEHDRQKIISKMMAIVSQFNPWGGNGKPSEPNQSKPTTTDDGLMTTTNGLPTEDGRGDGSEGTKDTRVQVDNRIVGRKDENGNFRAANESEVQHRDDCQSRRKSEEELRQKMQPNESQMWEMEQSILKYKRECQRLREERAQVRKGQKAMETKCNLAEKESAGLRELLRMNQHNIQALQVELRLKEQEIKALQTASHHKEATNSQVAALLETHTSELEGAQTFLTKADTFSLADLILMVEGLNTDILETAAYITDTFDFGRSSQAISTRRQQSVHESVESGLGKIMTNLLVQQGRDQTLIQITVQAYLSRWCHHTASVWIIDAQNTGLSDTLADLYEIISANDEFICDAKTREINTDSL